MFSVISVHFWITFRSARHNKMPTSSLKLIQALIYGLTPIIIPIVFHTREVNEIFKLLLFDETMKLHYQMQHFFLFGCWD